MTATTAPIGELIDQFCDHLWLGDGLATTTLANHRQDMMRYVEWCTENKVDPLLACA